MREPFLTRLTRLTRLGSTLAIPLLFVGASVFVVGDRAISQNPTLTPVEWRADNQTAPTPLMKGFVAEIDRIS